MSAKAFGVEQIGDCLLIRPEAVPDLVAMTGRARDWAKARPETRKHLPRWEAQRAIILRAFASRTSESGHHDVAEQPDLRKLTTGQGHWIGTADAAARTGLSRRQLQRVARSLSLVEEARRVGNSWAIDPAALSTYLVDRQQNRVIV